MEFASAAAHTCKASHLTCHASCAWSACNKHNAIAWAAICRWANPENPDAERNKTKDERRVEAYKFYTNERARDFYKQYVKRIVENFR